MKKLLILVVMALAAGCGNNSTQSGGLPSLVAHPDTLAFGNISIGMQSAPETLTVTNVGTFPAENLSLLTGGSGVTNYEFNTATDCAPGVTIPPNASCTMILTFVPQSPAGDKPAFIDLIAQPDNIGVQVILTGTGIATP